MLHRTGKLLLAAGLLGAAAVAVRADEPIAFDRDVMAVLAKGGCSAGACHGNQNGKGGFKLSLRGQDPAADYLAITRDQLSRRINLAAPERSLVLIKPTLGVAHEGGRRFRRDSPEYRLLLGWLSAGAPASPAAAPRLTELVVTPAERVLVEPERELTITATARFSDGSTRDVSRLAVYEPVDSRVSVTADGRARFAQPGPSTVLVRYLNQQRPVRLALAAAQPGFTADAGPREGYIDALVLARLDALRISPSPPADETALVRRLYVDLLGRLPSGDEAREFCLAREPDKLLRLADRLLARPEFADFWALKWSDLLRNEEKVLDGEGVARFHDWIRRAIAEGKPLDQFARELLSAQGSSYAHPPANFYRAHRDPTARSEAAAQVFLGARLQCARCHNHPFDRWTQDDYYRWAACFSGIGYKIVENKRKDENDKHEFVGEQIVEVAPRAQLDNPRGGSAAPRCLGAPEGIDVSGPDRLTVAAAWLTSQRAFAEVQANRIWFHLLGRGIVAPIDDVRATNPPSNPQLLAALADDLAAHHFDLRHLLRAIVRSRTYRLSSLPNSTNAGDEANFSHALLRRLPAETLLDSVAAVLEAPPRWENQPAGTRSVQLAGVRLVRDLKGRGGDPAGFLRTFGKPPRLVNCECERSDEATLAQVFLLVSGELLAEMLAQPHNRLGKLLASGRSSAQIVDELYWQALSRPPHADELRAALARLDGGGDRRAALEDLAWALLNSKEFLLRR